jgi:hypothetical protein
MEQPPPRSALPCNRCYALERAPANAEPHESLRLIASAELLSGVREEYVCTICQQRMIRFRPTQTWPPPSDVWRFASTGASQPIVSENILSRIPGNYVAEAVIMLPPAESANDGTIMDRFVTVPGVGKVRITARRMKYKHGGSMHFFWTAESAVLIETSERE